MGLRYEPGPKLDLHLRTLRCGAAARSKRGAAAAIPGRGAASDAPRLRAERALIGFVGGPFTLYVYAAAGSHEGFTRRAARPRRRPVRRVSASSCWICWPTTWRLQARAGADCVALFDTAAGALDRRRQFARHALSAAAAQRWTRFRASCPHTPLIYYSRDTGPEHWRALEALDLQCLGVDWRHELADTLRSQTPRWCLQGNLDPQWLLLPPAELEARVRAVFAASAHCPRRRAPPGCAARSRRIAANARKQRAPGAQDPARDLCLKRLAWRRGQVRPGPRRGSLSAGRLDDRHDEYRHDQQQARFVEQSQRQERGMGAFGRRRCTK